MARKPELLVICLVLAISAGEDFDYKSSNYQKPPPMILLHKQALSKDGNFNFVFTSENGLKQGETIRPDGTRQGGYSYVDPDGNTHTVKYVAGKDGFKILEGNVPKAPELPSQHDYILNQHQQIRQQHLQAQTARDAYDQPIRANNYQQPNRSPFQQRIGSQFSQPIKNPFEQQPIGDDYNRPPLGDRNSYEPPHKNPFAQQHARIGAYQQPTHNFNNDLRKSVQYSSPSKLQYRVQEDSRQVAPQSNSYQNEHKGPHNFGSGYSFEFSG